MFKQQLDMGCDQDFLLLRTGEAVRLARPGWGTVWATASEAWTKVRPAHPSVNGLMWTKAARTARPWRLVGTQRGLKEVSKRSQRDSKRALNDLDV